MRKYLLIGIGGALGAILRALIMDIPIGFSPLLLPYNTLIINICGSFLLALILTVAYEILELDTHIRLAIASGFLGAFTTFSTICQETVFLLFANEFLLALLYFALTIILGFIAAYLGFLLAKGAISKLINNHKAVNKIIKKA